ncbi:MAG: hypothetical protein M3198_06890 [Actinomycetota bacterium]|nr:hypothetical protein [Actinomycetota bacterium]
MRKLVVLALVVGLLGSYGAVAEAGKKKKKIRTVTFTYAHPSIGVAPIGGFCAGFPEEDCYSVATKPKEKYFKITVTDATGEKVFGFVSQGDLNGNGVNDDGYGNFCGGHTSSVAIAAPGKAMNVYLQPGLCDDGTQSVMTTGTVKVQLSAKPF